MNTYKVEVTETKVGHYLIEAESPEQAEDIYYGNEVGQMSDFHEDGVESEYVVDSVELAKGDEQGIETT